MAYKILIAEDNKEVRNLLRLSLSLGNYEIREMTNGLDALACIRSWRPHIVLLDIMMPGDMDGLEVCRTVKQDSELASTMIALVTARGQAQDLQAGVEAGADTYLIKPFSPLVLSSVISTFSKKLEEAQRASE